MLEPAHINGAMGGALIGLSAALYLALSGGIAGISGLLRSLTYFPKPGKKLLSALFFLLGLIGGAWAYQELRGTASITYAFPSDWLIPAGILVGAGTSLGSGCTSGHGICGISRFSPRSLIATATFVATAILTVFIVRTLGSA